jgi:hypothetical protein
MTWTTELIADTNANHAEITGNVVATSKEDDGTTTVARGQKLLMELASKRPTSRPSMKNSLGIAMTGGSAVGGIRTFTLEQDVEVNSTLLGADGTIQRRISLFAPSLTYSLTDKRMLIPTAGRMLYQDERPPPATQPADATKPGGELGDTRGATAFEWQKSFTYDSTDRRATMTGDVVVVHQAPGATAPTYRLNSQRVVAEMLPPPTTRPSHQPAAGGEFTGGGAKVKRLTADGGVAFASSRLQFSSDSIEFDPQAHQLVARGTDRVPATLLDESGLSRGTFAEMYYDTKTDQMKLVKPQASLRR